MPESVVTQSLVEASALLGAHEAKHPGVFNGVIHYSRMLPLSAQLYYTLLALDYRHNTSLYGSVGRSPPCTPKKELVDPSQKDNLD